MRRGGCTIVPDDPKDDRSRWSEAVSPSEAVIGPMSVEQIVPPSEAAPWRRPPLAGLWRRFGPERVRRWAEERDRAVEDAYQAGEIRWRWREASMGAGLGQLFFTPSGATTSVPVVTRVDVGPTTTLTVRLRPGQLADDIEQLIRSWSIASVRAGHRAAPRSSVKLNIMPLCMCSAIWQ